MVEYVEFHNPTAAERVVDLVFDLRTLPPELAVSLQLTPLTTTQPLEDSLDGVAASNPSSPGGDLLAPAKPQGLLQRLLALVRLLLCWIFNLARTLLGRPRKPCRPRVVRLPTFAPTVYEAERSQRVTVRGVRIEPFGWVAAAVAVENTGSLEPESEHSFEIQQWVPDVEIATMVGGGRYVVVTGGESKKKRNPVVAPTHDPDTSREEIEALEKDAERYRYVPPFARRIVEEREREQRKDI